MIVLDGDHNALPTAAKVPVAKVEQMVSATELFVCLLLRVCFLYYLYYTIFY